MSKQAKEVLEADKLEAIADRGYFEGQEIPACEEAGISVTLPKPMTSNAKADGRFGKQDFAICLIRKSTAARLASCCPIATPMSSME